MRVLVTGALGNVGRSVLNSLLLMGEQVVAAGTSIDKLNLEYGEMGNVKTMYFDFKDETTFQACLEGVDRVFC